MPENMMLENRTNSENRIAKMLVEDERSHCRQMEALVARQDAALRLTGERRTAALRVVEREVADLRQSHDVLERATLRFAKRHSPG